MHLRNRTQNRGVLLNVAAPQWKAGLKHPLLFLLEVFNCVPFESSNGF